jgi:hypothetical protein
MGRPPIFGENIHGHHLQNVADSSLYDSFCKSLHNTLEITCNNDSKDPDLYLLIYMLPLLLHTWISRLEPCGDRGNLALRWFSWQPNSTSL